jgi:hypothetical protein
VIREDTLYRTAFGRFGSGDFGPYGPDTGLARWTVGVTAGADVGVQISRHVQIVPQIRLHWIERATLGGTDSVSALLGLSAWVIRPGVGIRFDF